MHKDAQLSRTGSNIIHAETDKQALTQTHQAIHVGTEKTHVRKHEWTALETDNTEQLHSKNLAAGPLNVLNPKPPPVLGHGHPYLIMRAAQI